MSGVSDSSERCSFSFAEVLGGFLIAQGLPFASVLSPERIEAVFARHGNLFGRIYSTPIVLWAWMSQVLRDGKEAACQAAVSRISSHWQLTTGDSINPNSSDYCRARAKLSEEALRELSGEIAIQCEAAVDPKHLFKGRHAKLIDGSTFLMPDTPRNQKAYPQNPAQKPGLGFPIARFVIILSLATAAVIDCAIGKYKGKETGETSLLRQLLGSFSKGDLAVADRFYGNYWMIALLMAQGVDICFRKHQGRVTDFRTGKRLGKNDHLVTWYRPDCPSWMSEELYRTIPESITLREIRYVITARGRRQQPFVVVTTLFQQEGPQEVSSTELADLFGFRWNAEIDIDAIKTHMNLHHLRCKSPEMVHREFWTTMLTYNVIRTTTLSAAELSGRIPRQISFVTACQYVLAAWDVAVMTGRLMDPAILHSYRLSRLKQLGQCLVGNRPGRFEPRVLKKRKKNYNLMVQPRHQLKQRLGNGDNSFENP